MTRSRAAKPHHVGMSLHEVRVRFRRQLSPHLVRMTLAAESLREFLDDGPDQRCKLMLARPGQQRPELPPLVDWYGAWLAMPVQTRPILRTYTIRQARPAAGEVDLDLAVHGAGSGPGSRWAATARPGDRVGLLGAWAEYHVEPDIECELIAGDLSALPAIAAILERLAPHRQAHVVIELSDPADRVALDLPAGAEVRPGVELRYVRSRPGAPGAALIEAVRQVPALPASCYAWFAADQDTAAALRRHAVRERGLSPDRVMFMGYWRPDGAIDRD